MKALVAKWFVGLVLFFAIANTAGAIRPMGLKPFRMVGFPYTFKAWGYGIEEFFDWQLLALDIAIALLCSAFLAVMLSKCRNRMGR